MPTLRPRYGRIKGWPAATREAANELRGAAKAKFNADRCFVRFHNLRERFPLCLGFLSL